ncbi:unnamed protein product [Rotaria sordida]|uniref:G-protein coupled receptors family 1 profile domain-containing protein n=1 Tax=Rotaria sordida TaxID=392033 RepID=A0A818QVK4_9BILA|nr:unnamed protein product [Rotaria sordida]CAF3647464.1 unnamed protein product [Rotaria sordida]
MSSDSQPSFRSYWKSKVKNVIKPNITSSIRGHLISNDTYHNLREKYQNFTDIAKDRIDLGTIINKTKTLIPSISSSNDNQTFSKGFYDSLFSPETDQDVYFEVAIICLWVIAILCIIPTIIIMFIPVKKYGIKPSGVKLIFFHIFLCELCYLIYILLAMINAAENFQMNRFFCNFANYAMYITIPVMHFALFFLSLERLSKRFTSTVTWTRIFTKTYVTQVILIFIWISFIAIITTIILLKEQVWTTIGNNVQNIAPPIARDVLNKIISPSYRCSIDGRLLSIFKILFIILFIILIVLIIKSMAISIFYNVLTLNFCQIRNKMKKSGDRYMTLLFFIFLLLNVFLSFPFYFVSMTNTITQLITRKNIYSTNLKICFLLRILSIILQCLTFSTFESNSWNLLSRLLYRITCKKISILNYNAIPTKKSTTTTTTTKRSRHTGDSDYKTASYVDRRTLDTDSSDNDDNRINNSDSDTSENDSDDEVFLTQPKIEPSRTKSGKTTTTKTVDVIKSSIDSDDETQHIPKLKLSTKKSNEKKNQIDEDKMSIKKLTSEYNKTNGISQKLPNGKLISQRISSTTTKPKISKSNTNHRRIEHHPIEISSSSLSDEISNVSQCSDDEIKPSKTMSKIKSTNHTISNEQKHTTDISPNQHHSARQQHRTRNRLQSPISTNHHRIKTKKQRKRSSINKNNHIEKSKKNRLSKILNNSDDV